MRVLDAGCGVGRWAFHVAPWVSRVDGVDISGRMIRIANRLRQNQGVSNVFFDKAPLHALPFPDRCFDAVLCVTALQHVPETRLENAVSTLCRVTKPGGRIYLVESTHPSAANSYLFPRSVDRLKKLFHRHGARLDVVQSLFVVPLDRFFRAASRVRPTASLGKESVPKPIKSLFSFFRRLVLWLAYPVDAGLAPFFRDAGDQKIMVFQKGVQRGPQ